MDWTSDDVLAEVRAGMGGIVRPELRAGMGGLLRPAWAVERVDLDGDHVMVVIRVGDRHFGVLYSLADLPVGPNTGEPCDTPRDWGDEIGWDMEEQMDTGGLLRAERIPGPDGLVRLRWRV